MLAGGFADQIDRGEIGGSVMGADAAFVIARKIMSITQWRPPAPSMFCSLNLRPRRCGCHEILDQVNPSWYSASNAGPSTEFRSCAWRLAFEVSSVGAWGAIAGTVKLLLPPRQSRGNSHVSKYPPSKPGALMSEPLKAAWRGL
jgi:hypothetical protein